MSWLQVMPSRLVTNQGRNQIVSHSKLLKTILALLTVAGIAFVFTAPMASAEEDSVASAGEKSSEPMKTKAAKRRGTGEDENITTSTVENDLETRAPAPKEKGGDATRGSRGCRLIVDNWTPWMINIYVDGSYSGMVSSWGKADGWFASGRRNVYAVAPFRDASDLTWGPERVNCQGSYTWQLID